MNSSNFDNTNDFIQACAVCRKTKNEVEILLKGPYAFLCNECAQAGVKFSEDFKRSNTQFTKKIFSIPTPKEIHAHFDELVIGQEIAKKTLAVGAYNHYKRVALLDTLNSEDETEITKSNILILGPTGSGKTLLAQSLAQQLKLPFAIVDATTLTEAGYVGEDVENILQRLLQDAEGDIEKAQKGIVYLDEIDKLSRRSENPSITRDVSGEGVQYALLKLLEGTVASVPLQGSRKHPQQENTVLVNTKNILFICGGTFSGIEKIISERTEKTGIGFGTKIRHVSKDTANGNILMRLETEDLIKYGLVPELIGRLSITTSLTALNQEQMVSVLTEPKNALVKQYKKLFRYNDIQLEFDQEALIAIADEAFAMQVGARALRAILEKHLLNLMYELPSREDIATVRITANFIRQQSKPLLFSKNAQEVLEDQSVGA